MNASFETLCRQICVEFDPRSERAGRLIYRSWPGFIHYAIGLSDSRAISWEPEYKPSLWGRGVLSVDATARNYADAVHVHYHERPEILQNLMASVYAFHTQWNYCARGWNCEHWARLVVSGVPRSYQCKQAYASIAVITGGHFDNPDAATRLRAFRQIGL
jgi:hypothetical protein